MTKTLPPELGARMLAQGIANEIERCTGKLPVRRGMRPLLAHVAGWGIMVLLFAGALRFFVQ